MCWHGPRSAFNYDRRWFVCETRFSFNHKRQIDDFAVAGFDDEVKRLQKKFHIKPRGTFLLNNCWSIEHWFPPKRPQLECVSYAIAEKDFFTFFCRLIVMSRKKRPPWESDLWIITGRLLVVTSCHGPSSLRSRRFDLHLNLFILYVYELELPNCSIGLIFTMPKRKERAEKNVTKLSLSSVQ